MARSVVTSRTAAVNRTTLSRSLNSAFRLPTDWRDYGISYLWDFRTGATNEKSRNVQSMIGDCVMTYRGGTAVASIYSVNQYMADLEASNSDYFESTANIPTAANHSMLSVMGWFKRESIGTVQDLISQWTGNLANSNAWIFRINANNKVALSCQNSAGTAAEFETDVTMDNTGAYHSIAFVFNAGTVTIFIDGQPRTNTRISGSAILNIRSTSSPIRIGASVNGGGATTEFWDGRVGISAVAYGTAWTNAQVATLHAMFNSYGNYGL